MWLIISVVLPTYWYSSQREKQRSRGDAWYTTPGHIQPAERESHENHRMDTGSTPRRSLASLLLCHLNINFPPQDRLALAGTPTPPCSPGCSSCPTASSPTPLPPTGTLPSREPERQMASRHRSDPPGPAPPPQTPSPYTNGPSFSDSQPLETEPSN